MHFDDFLFRMLFEFLDGDFTVDMVAAVDVDAAEMVPDVVVVSTSLADETCAVDALDNTEAALHCVLDLASQKKQAVATHLHAFEQHTYYCQLALQFVFYCPITP